MENINKALERMWLILSVLALLMAIYFMVTEGVSEAYYYLIFPAIAGAMYMMRRAIRVRLENSNNDQLPKRK